MLTFWLFLLITLLKWGCVKTVEVFREMGRKAVLIGFLKQDLGFVLLFGYSLEAKVILS